MMLRTQVIVFTAIVSSAFANAQTIEIKKESDLKFGKPTVIKFFAEWCGPCKTLKPKYEELSKKSEFKDSVHFYTVDVDKQDKLSKKYGVMSMPTIAFFDANGNEAKELRIVGGAGDFTQRATSAIKKIMGAAPAKGSETKNVKKDVKPEPKKTESTSKKM